MDETTQADRDAAADLAEWLTKTQDEWGGGMVRWFALDFPDAVRRGIWDGHKFVQAFARRRTEAIAAHTKALIEGGGELCERLVGGKCPECRGWGEIAYFGEMVPCRCRSRYESPVSMGIRAQAAATIAAQAAEIERAKAEGYRAGIEAAAEVVFESDIENDLWVSVNAAIDALSHEGAK